MIQWFAARSRCVVVPCLAAVGLLLVACESPQNDFRRQAARPAASLDTGTPTAPASLAPPATSAPVHQEPTIPQTSVNDTGTPVPSLVPYLTRPGVGEGTGAAPGEPAPPPLTAQKVRVALLLPLSGANAALGKAMLNAAQLAIFDFADERFELVIQDTEGTPAGATAAASKAIGDGASIILGPLLSASVRAVTPAARAAGVAVVAFSSDRSVAGDGVYTMGFFPGAEVRRVVGFARSRGILRFASLAPDNDYGHTVVEALRQAAEKDGAVVSRVQFFDPAAGDFSDVVRELADYGHRRQALEEQRSALEARHDEIARRALDRLAQLQTIGDVPFDALLLAAGGERLRAIAAMLPFFDVDPARVRILGTGQWDEPGLGSEPALVGGWFAAPAPAARAAFVHAYTDAYGHAPPRLATLAYDATALAAVLGRGETEPHFSAAALTAPNGFSGRDGIFRFGADGLAQRGLAVLEVQPRGAKVISAAPETFAPATQ